MSGPPTLGEWEAGERIFADVLGERLTGRDLDRPSSLAGWTRRMVIAHVARNADALVNLLTWARTGVETPMYPSREARDAEIAEAAAQEDGQLVGDCLASARRLEEAVRQLPTAAWSSEVRTAQGRIVPASEIPWIRCRELWVHAIDLEAGVTFRDVPEEVLSALAGDVLAMWERRGCTPPIRFRAAERTWGPGPQTVDGSLPELVGWMTGRRSSPDLRGAEGLPQLPPWL